MTSSLRAILFDFDGVIADTEPIHLALFQQVLKEEGVRLTESEYLERYLGLDDRACFAQVYRDQGKGLPFEKLGDLVQRKNESLLSFIKGRSLLLPGVKELLNRVSGRYFCAVVSGALKSEIIAILRSAEILDRFQVIVGADDVSQGKPHPEGFLMAMRLLNRNFVPPSEILLAAECLAIEDSPWGITAAHKAGARCLGVMNSYGQDRLKEADLVVKDLSSLDWQGIERLFIIS